MSYLDPLSGSPDSTEDCGLLSEHGIYTSSCPSDTPTPPIPCNSAEITIEQPPYLQSGPGFACSISANYSSILSSCCGNSTFTAFGNYTSYAAAAVFGENCPYSYCKVADAAAEDAFMGCFNASGLREVGVKAKCFISPVRAPYVGGSGGRTEVTARGGRLGVGGWGVVVLVLGQVVGRML